MEDDAPIFRAHEHARNASRQTVQGRLSAAGSEHREAASLYQEVAKSCSDGEALRTLTLLEDHHRRLASIIRHKDRELVAPSEKPHQPEELTEPILVTAEKHPPQPTVKDEPAAASSTPLSSSPQARLKQSSISSPALAKDIASRRGIPTPHDPTRTPSVTTNVSSIKAMGRMSSRPQNIESVPTNIADRASRDESFSKFYSTMTTGSLSKLSSMLAFAGLPLSEHSARESLSDHTRARSSDRPEVERYFSRAALRAIEDQQRQQGFTGNTFGGGESFYVIPTSGGTASYANILSRAQHNVEPAAPSDGNKDATSKISSTTVDNKNNNNNNISTPSGRAFREEELLTENESLKHILDKLSHRLQAFESHAQDASMAALAQSSTWARRSSAHASPELEDRMRAMEGQLEREMRERERLSQDNQKQKQIIVKYRSHWEQLKNSARAKEQAKRQAAQPDAASA